MKKTVLKVLSFSMNVLAVSLIVGASSAHAVTYTLTVSKTGSGSGTVTSSPAGINCGTTCSASYNSGTVVTLTASPTSPAWFEGWNGACTGSSTTCNVTMGAAKTVYAVFRVHASGTAISPMLVGNSVWYAPATGGGFPDSTTWSRAATAKLKFVRIGGNEYDNNFPSNTVLEGWVNQIKAIGAVPMIQIPHTWKDTPNLAANVVTYFNLTTGNRVDYWAIGNEMNFAYGWNSATIATLIKNCSSAMKAADPSIKIYAVDENWYNPTIYDPLLGGASDITGKDANNHWYVDGITFHSYPNGSSYTRADVFDTDLPDIRSKAATLVSKLATANSTQGRTGSAALGWGLTEYNITYANPATNGIWGLGVAGFMNGQFHGEVLGIGMQYGAQMVVTWSMSESSGDRSAGDLSYLDGTAKDPRSSFYHMQMVSDNLSGFYAATTSTENNVRVVASKSDAQIAVLIMNHATSGSYDFTVRLNTTTPTTGTVKITVAASIGIEYSDTINNQQSMLLVFNGAGDVIKKLTYSVNDNGSNMPPH